jgi:hypothetical protein
MTGEKMKECVHRTQMPPLPAQVNRYFDKSRKPNVGWTDGQTYRQMDRHGINLISPPPSGGNM